VLHRNKKVQKRRQLERDAGARREKTPEMQKPRRVTPRNLSGKTRGRTPLQREQGSEVESRTRQPFGSFDLLNVRRAKRPRERAGSLKGEKL
jgi:hypothetical protein